MVHLRPIIFAVLILFLKRNLLCQNSERFRESDIVKVGEPCPQFTITSSVKDKDVISSTFKGSVTLINFFATWCGPCLTELPELEKKIWEKYKNNKNFRLIVIGRGEGDQTVESFKTKNGFTFPMYADSLKLVYEIFAKKYIPRNYIIDKQGIIVYSGISYSEYEFDLILKNLEELLR